MLKLDFLEESKIKFDKRYWTTLAIFVMGFFVVHSLLFGQSLLVYAAALVFTAIAIFLYPSTGLYMIVVLTMWFERHFTLQELVIGGRIYKLYPLDIVLLLIGIGLLVQMMNRKIKFRIQKFDIYILLFGVVSFGGFIQGMFRSSDFGIGFSTFKNYFLYAVVYLFVILLVRTKEDWKEFMRWFTVGGFGLFFFLAYGIFSGSGLWSEFTPLSTFGTRLIAGTHAFYMVLFAFWLLSLFLWRTKENKGWQKVIPYILFATVIGLLISLVRHLWASVAVLVGTWYIFLKEKQRQSLVRIIGGVGSVLVVFFLLYTLLGTSIGGSIPEQARKILFTLGQRVDIGNVVNLSDSSFGWRTSVWKSTLRLWSTQPILGIGFGQNITGFHDVFPFVIPVRDVHNNYLGILLQLGIVGFGVVVCWFLWILRLLYRMWKKFSHYDNFLTQLFFMWGSTVLLFIGVFSISVYWDINLFIIWWWIGLAALRYLSTGHTKDI